MEDDKRTKIGPAGPVRAATGAGRPVVATTTTAPVPRAPTTDAPSGPSTSYLPPQVDPLLGQTLAGRYLIQNKLGEGGMATVYLATHNLLDKQVALKVLHGEFARKPELVERFMQEARAASRIRHENVIDISDFGATPEGLVFFAMELLEGHDLHDEIGRARVASQLLPWERSKRIFLQICGALTAAHALGIIHRDLKPENIYLVDRLGDPDFVKLLDFGIAKQTELAEGDRKLTRTGMLFGTPEYMSPEQARGEAFDHRVDIYAMGCLLFQLVTGRVPFEAQGFMGVLTMHLTEPPPVVAPEVLDSIGAPQALAEVIARAMAKDRNQRFATMDELAQAVRRASGDKAPDPVVAQASVPAPAMAAIARSHTQWTGSPSIPARDAAAAPRRSKLPGIVGAVILVGGTVGAAAFLATRGDANHGSAMSSPTPDPAGSAVPPVAAPAPPVAAPAPPVAAPAPPVTAPAPPVAPPPPADPALTFAWARIRIDSRPSGADVRDLTSGTRIGRTPFTVKVQPSHSARQFGLHRRGYVDAVIELVPDREVIEYTEKLVRGTSHAPAVAHPGTDPQIPPPTRGSAAASPEPPLASPEPPLAKPEPPLTKPEPPLAKPEPPLTKPEPPPPQAGSAAAKPAKPPEEDCEPPCLKVDPSRAGSAGGSAP